VLSQLNVASIEQVDGTRDPLGKQVFLWAEIFFDLVETRLGMLTLY
jgi:hypothetical protein